MGHDGRQLRHVHRQAPIPPTRLAAPSAVPLARDAAGKARKRRIQAPWSGRVVNIYNSLLDFFIDVIFCHWPNLVSVDFCWRGWGVFFFRCVGRRWELLGRMVGFSGRSAKWSVSSSIWQIYVAFFVRGLVTLMVGFNILSLKTRKLKPIKSHNCRHIRH